MHVIMPSVFLEMTITDPIARLFHLLCINSNKLQPVEYSTTYLHSKQNPLGGNAFKSFLPAPPIKNEAS